MRQCARVPDVLLTRSPPQVALTQQAGCGSAVLNRSMSRSRSASGKEGGGVSRSEGTGRARGEVRVALTGLRPRMVYNKGGRPFGGGGERLLVAACL